MTGILREAMHDTRLSLKALGLLIVLVDRHHGEVPPARLLAAYHADGRDAVRSGLRELRELGYITTVRHQSRDGQWSTLSVVVPGAGDLGVAENPAPATRRVTETGFSGPLPSVNQEPQDQVLVASKPFPNGNVLLATRLTARQGESVGYDFFEKTSDGVDPEGIGLRIEAASDKANRRRDKYGSANTVSVARTSERHGKDVSRWTLADMVAEFSSLTYDHAPDRAGQLNAKGLGARLQQYRKQGASTPALVQGIRDFFADPGNLHGVGSGSPLWLRFTNWFPQHQSRLEAGAGTEVAALDAAMAEQVEHMLQARRKF